MSTLPSFSSGTVASHAGKVVKAGSKYYWIQNRLGKGAYGSIHHITESEDGGRSFQDTHKVIKISKSWETAHREATLLRECILPNIVQIHTDFTITTTEQKTHYLVLERLGMSLLDLLRKEKKGLPLNDVCRMVYDTLNALDAMRKRGYLHLDIKPGNICLERESSPQVKVIDFSCARETTSEDRGSIQTRWYRAPEVVIGSKGLDKADMFSVGALLYELLRGKVLLPSKDNFDHVARLIRLLGLPPPSFSEDDKWLGFFSSNGQWDHAFVRKGTSIQLHPQLEAKIEQVKRFQPSLDAILTSLKTSYRAKLYPYESQKELDLAFDLMKRLLTWNPADRLSAEDALKHSWFRSISSSVKSVLHPAKRRRTEPPLPPPLIQFSDFVIHYDSPVTKEKQILLASRSASSSNIEPSEVVKISTEAHNIIREAKRLQLFSGSPHIVQYITYTARHDQSYLFLERLGPNLKTILDEREGEALPLHFIRKIVQGILSALDEIEKKEFLHLALEPKHICTKRDNPEEIKLIDFASAQRTIWEPKRGITIQPLLYRAPEASLLINSLEKADLFSLGLILYELLVGKPLLPGKSPMDQVAHLIALLGRPSETFFDLLSKGLRRWYLRTETGESKPAFYRDKSDKVCLSTLLQEKVDELRRFVFLNRIHTLSLDDIKHKRASQNDDPQELKLAVEFMKKLLLWDPRERPSAAQGLELPWFKDLKVRIRRALV